MSFSALKSARTAKERHSFLKTAPVPARAEEVGGAAPEFAEQNRTDVEASRERHGRATEPVERAGLYGALPTSLEVRSSAVSGRGVYAKAPFSPGSVLVSLQPHVSVVSTGLLESYCSACCAPAAPVLKRCTRCKAVWYCNSTCQNRDWALHKDECAALQKWAASAPSPDLSIPSEAVRCLGRILWGERKEGRDSTWAREIRSLQSHRSTLQPCAFESHTHLAHSVVRYLGVSSPLELQTFGLNSAAELVDLISRFTTNTFTVTAPSLTPIGICVSPTAALVNHSCDPNAVMVFPRSTGNSTAGEPMASFIAIRDISLGEEVAISYVDTTLPRETRQNELKETYNFVCGCTLCSQPPSIDPRTAMWCPKKCGGMCPLPTEDDPLARCAKCKAAVPSPEAVLDAARVGQEALDKASALQFKDPENAKRLASKMVPILTGAGLAPSAHPLLAMLHLHQELLIAAFGAGPSSQELLDETIRTAATYNAGLQAVLPKGHPVRAVALGKLGRLLAVDEPSPASGSGSGGTDAAKFPPSGPPRLKLAHESLVRAHEEMLIGYGRQHDGGELGRETRDAILRLEKELCAWTTGIRNALEDQRAGARAKAG